MARRARWVRWPVVAVVVILGLAAIGAGIAMRTVWLPDSSYRASTEIQANTPLVVTAPGVLEMLPGPVLVTAEGSPESTLIIARGRQQDVQAWVGDAETATITGLAADNRLGVATRQGSLDTPDPAASQLWIDQTSGKGQTQYTYRETTGRFLLLFGTAGGQSGPTSITFTWPQAVVTPYATPLVVAGGVLLLVAAAMAISLFVRSRRAAAEEVATTLRPKVSLVKDPARSSESDQDGVGTGGARRGGQDGGRA